MVFAVLAVIVPDHGAYAQDVKLVGNASVPRIPHRDEFSNLGDYSTRAKLAQIFVTGDEGGGYLLNHARVLLTSTHDEKNLRLEASIRLPDSDGEPSDTHTLTLVRNKNVNSYSHNHFNVPSGTSHVLLPNTKYFLVFDCRGCRSDNDNAVGFHLTNNNGEDSDGRDDWELGNGRYLFRHGSGWDTKSTKLVVQLYGRNANLAYIKEDGIKIISEPTALPDTYVRGDTIRFEVKFDQVVSIKSGTNPTFRFRVTGGDNGHREASYYEHSGDGRRLRFAYTIAPGDGRKNNGIGIGDHTATWQTDSEGIVGTNGKSALLIHEALGLQAGHNVRADLVRAYIESISVLSTPLLAGQPYGHGEIIKIQVEFDRPVTVTGTPKLRLRLGGIDRSATYAPGESTATSLVFNYTVRSFDYAPDGLSIRENALARDGDPTKGPTENATIVDNGPETLDAGLESDALENLSAHRVEGSLMTIVDPAPEPPPVHTLVSNTEQPANNSLSWVDVGNDGGNKWSMAQGFRSGTVPGDYTLSSAEVYLGSFDSIDETRVSIHTADASGNPITELYELAAPDPITDGAFNSFTAPEDATLANETDYALVVELADGDAFQLGTTDADSEDESSGPGWTIKDNRSVRDSDGGVWRSATGPNLRISIQGVSIQFEAVGEPVIVGNAQVRHVLTPDVSDITDVNGTPNEFRYRWVRTDSLNTETTVGRDTSYQIENSDINSTIKVQVRFIDGAGYVEGPLTSAATDPIEPPPPDNLRVYPSSMQSGSTTELNVQWQPPGHLDGDPAEIDSYDVRYRKQGAQGWKNGPRAVTVPRATITGLKESTAYEVQVRSTVSGTGGPWSVSASGKTRTAGQPYSGDVRLSDGRNADEGRLEIFHRGVWGSICSDRFSHPGGGDNGEPENIAPAVACRMMGYDDGKYVWYGRDLPKSRQNPIWLDDVVCKPDSTHWTGSPATRLEQCHHAGWGLNNCTHWEDAGVACSHTDETQGQSVSDNPAFTVGFEDVPEAHDGTTPFTVAIRFSEAPHGPGGEVTDATLQDALGVTNGTVTSVERVNGDAAHRIATIAPDGPGNVAISLLPGADCADAAAICTAGGAGLSTAAVVLVAGGPPAFTVGFEDAPEAHDGTTAFTVGIRFGKEPEIWNAALRDALQASAEGGTVESVSRAVRGGDRRHRVATVLPDGDGPVTLSLEPSADCDGALALCTAEGETLAATVALEIPGPEADEDEAAGQAATETSGTPFTASFANAPAVHQGRGKRFTVDLAFSETPRGTGGTPPSMTNAALLGALEADGGEVEKVRRIARSPTARRVTVNPDGIGAVTLRLDPPADCADAGAACTEDGRPLSAAASVTVEGPPGLSVADAGAEEGPGAVMEFAVTLDRPVTVTVEVDYRTEDIAGLAEAGADYEAASGTLAFAPGETSKTIAVTVLDDAHDEGSESFLLWLENPVNAHLDDFVAVGTIRNADPVPQAWLSRFGRTVAGIHLDAVRDRMSADRSPGVTGRFAGRPLPGRAAGAEGALGGPDTLPASRPAHPDSPAEDGILALHEPAVPDLRDGRDADPLPEDGVLALRSFLAGEERDEPEVRGLTGDDILLGTSFVMTRDSGSGVSHGFWGRASRAGFRGRDGETTVDGEVTGVMLGADWRRKDALFGIILSESRGAGTYRGASAGDVDARLAALVPWAGRDAGGGLSFWGAAGIGRGDMTLSPEGQEPVETGLEWSMAAAGAEGALAPGARFLGARLGWRADGLWTRTESDAATGLAAATGTATRLRLGTTARWERTLASGARLGPRIEAGLRHDGGDAETGLGLEVGGGVGFSDPAHGLSVSLDGRTLALHEDGAFRNWGLSLGLSWDPRPETRRGWSLSARQSYGGASSGGVGALLGPETFPGLRATEGGDRWSLEAAHGTGRGRGMVGSAYGRAAGTDGLAGLRLGWRIEPDAAHAKDASLDLWAEPGTGGGRRMLGAGLRWRW